MTNLQTFQKTKDLTFGVFSI